MARIDYTETALRDLDEIFDHIAEDSAQQADKLIRSVEEKIETISVHTGMGRHRDEMGVGLRSFPFASYIIFYRPVEDGLIVVRVLHTSRDISSDYFASS